LKLGKEGRNTGIGDGLKRDGEVEIKETGRENAIQKRKRLTINR
jgi:hypothetical protein